MVLLIYLTFDISVLWFPSRILLYFTACCDIFCVIVGFSFAHQYYQKVCKPTYVIFECCVGRAVESRVRKKIKSIVNSKEQEIGQNKEKETNIFQAALPKYVDTPINLVTIDQHTTENKGSTLEKIDETKEQNGSTQASNIHTSDQGVSQGSSQPSAEVSSQIRLSDNVF